jgi:hypothetical protein
VDRHFYVSSNPRAKPAGRPADNPQKGSTYCRTRAGIIVVTALVEARPAAMLPLEFMQRMATLVPRPRLHLIRFYDCPYCGGALKIMADILDEPDIELLSIRADLPCAGDARNQALGITACTLLR